MHVSVNNKRLCRYYFDIDPEVTVSYVHAYREMWDEQKPGKIRITDNEKFTGGIA